MIYFNSFLLTLITKDYYFSYLTPLIEDSNFSTFSYINLTAFKLFSRVPLIIHILPNTPSD